MIERSVQTAIENAIRESLGTSNVVDVRAVRDDIVYQDDEILQVTVYITHTVQELNQNEVLGLPRTIRQVLRKIGEHAFPIVSFVTSDDCRAFA